MATIKYLIKGKNNPSTIFMRFRAGRKYDFTKSTSLIIDPKFWNKKKGIVKQIADFENKKNLQNDLNALRSTILNKYNEVYQSGGVISSQWIDAAIKQQFNQSENIDFNNFIDYTEFFIKNLNNKVLPNGQTGVKENTLKRYNSILNKVRLFENFKKKRLRIIDIDLKFYKDFKDFLINNQNLNLNTTGRYIVYIKTICLDAKEYGIKINPDIEKKEFRETKEPITFVTLSESEINLIYNFDFTDVPYLDNARDWLILGVWTGARVSDLLQFTETNIEKGYIEYTSKNKSKNYITGTSTGKRNNS